MKPSGRNARVSSIVTWVLEALKTWAQLMNCRVSTHGSQLEIADSCLELAVIDSASTMTIIIFRLSQ